MNEDRLEPDKYPARDERSLDRLDPQRAGLPAERLGDVYGLNAPESNVLLREYWRRIYKHRWMILFLAMVVTTIVAIEVFRTKSIYQATNIVEIGKESRTLFRGGGVSIETDDNDYYYTVNLATKTKMRVIQSRPVLEEVVARLGLDKNPNFLDVTERKSFGEAIKTIIGRLRNPSNSYQPPTAVTTDVNSSAGSTARTAEESARLAPYIGVLAANLSAAPIEDTRMLAISFTHSNPVLATSIVNTVADVFIEQSFESKTKRYSTASTWLNDRMRELKAKVEKAERDLAAYTASHDIFSTDGKDNLVLSKLASLHGLATTAGNDRIIKESLYEEVKAGRLDQLPEAFADPKLAALQNEVSNLAVREAEIGAKYGPSNPRVIELRRQKELLEKQLAEGTSKLAEKLEADYRRTVREEKTLKEALEDAKTEASRQNQSNIQFTILRQNVDTASAFYSDFLQKTSQVEIQRAEQNNNIQLIEPAMTPGAPIGPRRLRTILLSLLLSLAGGAGIALAVEFFNNTIKTVDDIKRYINLPALAVIPSISARRSYLLGEKRSGVGEVAPSNGKAAAGNSRSRMVNLLSVDSNSMFAEAYRGLRTSILLSSAGHPPKTILMTSSQPGEGKTTTSINTAISLSQLGVSVLIIDADMRRPAAHKGFNVDYSRGLSTYLSRDIEAGELIHQLPIPNLWFMPSGAIPPNPAELISSQKMKDLLNQLGEHFDHILIDSPPLVSVTDPLILSTLVEGVILVVHGGRSSRNVVHRARLELANVGAKVFGVVLNNVNLKREGYDDYYYYRYHSYYYGSKDQPKRAESSGD